jgi:glutamate dehydrogenase
LLAAPAIVRLAGQCGVTTPKAARAWAAAGREFGIDALRVGIGGIAPGGSWGARAVAAMLDDLAALQGDFAAAALGGTAINGKAAAAIVREAAMAPDLAAALVAMRALRAVAHPGQPG